MAVDNTHASQIMKSMGEDNTPPAPNNSIPEGTPVQDVTLTPVSVAASTEEPAPVVPEVPAQEEIPATEEPAPAVEATEPPAVETPAQPVVATELTEEQKEEQALDILRKKTGNPDFKFEDLNAPTRVLTEAEQAIADEQLRTEATQFALKNNIFTLKDQEAFNVDRNRDAVDIARQLFDAAMLEANPTITSAELTEAFNEEYALEKLETDPRRIAKAKQIVAIKDAYIRREYGKIIGATDAYQADRSMNERAATFISNVNKAVQSLTTPINVEMKSTDSDFVQTVVLGIPQESLDAIAKEIMSPELSEAFGRLKPEILSSIISDIAKGRNLERFVGIGGDTYYSAKTIAELAKRQGVPPDSTGGHGSTLAGGQREHHINPIAQEIMKKVGT